MRFSTGRKQMAEADSDNSLRNSIIMYCKEYAKRWEAFLHSHPNIHSYVLKFKEHFAQNPFLQVATFIVVASLLTPVLLFIAFAIVSAVFAVVGFIILQVIVLAIGASILSCVLFCIASTLTMVGLCVLFIYYTLYYINHAFDLSNLRRNQ